MRVIELVRSNPLKTFAIAGVAVGVIAGILWPGEVVPTASEGNPQLALPSRQELRRFREPDFAQIRDGRLWGGFGSAQSGRAKMSGWRLLGVLVKPVPSAFVMVDKAKKAEQVAVGKMLPDGATLVAVSAGGIEVERNGCRFQRALYAAAEVAVEGPGCPVDNVSAASPPRGSSK